MTILDLSTDDLTKLINDEYSTVLVSDRANLPRAKAIGEKLEVLRGRVKHGEWQTKLRDWCPKISYETATRYIKLCKKWSDIEKAATAKSVRTTDLTIDHALKLLAKPKPDNGKASPKGNGAVDPPATRNPKDIGTEYLRALAVDELVIVLKEIHRSNTEYLQELSAALGKTLKPPSPVVPSVGLERRV